MIIIIDNYDSFTYNLYQYVGEINPEIEVYRNDAISVLQLKNMNPEHIIISPGPGYPKDAGISTEVVRTLGKDTPILGVCLGHQAIAEAYGGRIVHAKELMHGKASDIKIIHQCKLFDGLSEIINAGRYHSLIVQKESLPEKLEITATTNDGEIMGLKHIDYEVYGIQFHPESILTSTGKKILGNFLKIKKGE